MSAYTLPSVRPSTVSWMNWSTSGSYTWRGGPMPGRPAEVSRRVLADELVRAVRLNLEDVELCVQRVVGLRRPLERSTKDPVLDRDLLEGAEDGLTRGRAAAGLAGPRDGGQR